MPDDYNSHDQGQDGETDPLPDLPGISLTLPPLSRGPAGTVYKGWDSVHRCAVVVKTQRGAGDTVAADRFRREAAVMARLRHPNIVALYRFRDGDPSALIMEYVPGPTLAELVASGGPLEAGRTAGIIEGVAAALDRIHLEGIVHRDVKPSNILLPPRGPAKLTDFGVAHTEEGVPLTVVGDILGTIEYVSPEQVHGETTPDARSDVYSLAAVAYFALAGTPPFPATDSSTQAQLSVMHRQVFSPPPPFQRPGLSAEVEAAVLRGLAKKPDARPASAGQFAAGLRSAVEAGSGAPEAQATAVASSRRAGTLAGAAAGTALLLLGGLAVWKAEQSGAAHGPATHPLGASVHPTDQVPIAAAPHTMAPPLRGTKPAPKVAAKMPAKSTSAPARVAVADSVQERHTPRHSEAVPVPAAPHPARKAAVTERPRFRRHPEVVARAVMPAPARTPAKPAPRAAQAAPTAEALLSVYASQNNASVPARTVTVDGKPISALTTGGWASLPAGRHLLSYVPQPGSGFNPNPGLWVTLPAGAHITRRILLPAALRPRARVAAAVAAAATAPKPVVIAAAAPPPPASPSAAAVGLYNVSGWAASAAHGGGKASVVRAPAQLVMVDGQPVPELKEGGWATLTAGKHTVTFQPAVGLGVGPKTWTIDLAPSGHLEQQIPLPADPSAAVAWYTVSGWGAQNPAAAKPHLTHVSAQWVKVDGQPVLGLALGQWATLPAGKHIVTLQPTSGLGLAPKTWDIDLEAQGHLDQKIPLDADK